MSHRTAAAVLTTDYNLYYYDMILLFFNKRVRPELDRREIGAFQRGIRTILIDGSTALFFGPLHRDAYRRPRSYRQLFI